MLFVSLGRWQLRRADEHRQIQRAYTEAAELPVLGELPRAEQARQLRYRNVRLDGSYVQGVNILLDNMTYGGQPGYEVLTPFEPASGSAWLIVNRGWVSADPDRRVMPRVGLKTRPLGVLGRVAPWFRPAIRLGQGAVSKVGEGLLLTGYPTTEALAGALGHAVYPYQLLLDADAPEGFVRDWRPGGVSAERNMAYAGQWFLFGVCALGGAVAIVVGAVRRAVAVR